MIEDDRAVVERQIGRPPRAFRRVVVRCPFGLPAVTEQSPYDREGEPFPTMYYLTCRHLVAAVSRVEAAGGVERFTESATVDPGLRASLAAATERQRELRRALVMTFGDRTARLRTLRILNEIEEHLGNYLLLVTMINVGVGITTGIICAITGMPNPAGLGALAATLNFVPIIGPVAMWTVLVVVGVIAFPTIGGGLMAAALFAVMTFMEGHFITPTIVGRRLALNALAVFIALAFWTWLWGPMGAFLASPLLIVAVILKEHLMPVDAPQLPQD